MSPGVGEAGQAINSILGEIPGSADLTCMTDQITSARDVLGQLGGGHSLNEISLTLGQASLRLGQAGEVLEAARVSLSRYLSGIGFTEAEEPTRGCVVVVSNEYMALLRGEYVQPVTGKEQDTGPTKADLIRTKPEFVAFEERLTRLASELPEVAENYDDIRRAAAELLDWSGAKYLDRLNEPVTATIVAGLARRWAINKHKDEDERSGSEDNFLYYAIERLLTYERTPLQDWEWRGSSTHRNFSECGCLDQHLTEDVRNAIERLDLFAGIRSKLGVARGEEAPSELYVLDWDKIFDPSHWAEAHERHADRVNISSHNFAMGSYAFISSKEAKNVIEAARLLSDKRFIKSHGGFDKARQALADKLQITQHEYVHTQRPHLVNMPAPFCAALCEMTADALTDRGYSSGYIDLFRFREDAVETGISGEELTRVLALPTEEALVGLAKSFGLEFMVDIATCPQDGSGLQGCQHIRDHIGGFRRIGQRIKQARQERDGSQRRNHSDPWDDW